VKCEYCDGAGPCEKEKDNDVEEREDDAMSDCSSAPELQTGLTLTKMVEVQGDTLKTPEGPKKAVKYFSDAVDSILKQVKHSEDSGTMTYTYLYTAHPDKHCHSLGVDHENVKKVVEGISDNVERLYKGVQEICQNSASVDGVSEGATIFVTADHGHVNCEPEDQVVLPEEINDCCEYTNIGVHGKGRHALFHVKSGREAEFVDEWNKTRALKKNFLLLKIRDAERFGLLGPELKAHRRTRNRLGDFISLSLNQKSIVTKPEYEQYAAKGVTQGGHGSLLPEEMEIPFVLLKANRSKDEDGEAFPPPPLPFTSREQARERGMRREVLGNA